jgi:electron transfer flavoprotein alpha subunit
METMEIWVVAEQRDGEIREITLEMLREAKRLAKKENAKACAVLLGHNIKSLADILGHCGADKVYVAEDPALEQYSTDGYAAILTDLISKNAPRLVMIGASAYGRDLAPCLAVRLKAGFLSGCVMFKINDNGVIEGTRPAYSGKVYVSESSLGKLCVATVRPGVIGADKPNNSLRAEIVEVQTNIEPQIIRTKVTGFIKADPNTVDVTEADIIVCGGRGLGFQQQWELIKDLAKVLGASVAGTRVALDAGWIPRERMVGQSGRAIAPRCYIGAGISGASAHTAGMKESKMIIAINLDRTAPIFKVADVGVLGDAHQILPALIEQLAGKVENAKTGGGKK